MGSGARPHLIASISSSSLLLLLRHPGLAVPLSLADPDIRGALPDCLVLRFVLARAWLDLGFSLILPGHVATFDRLAERVRAVQVVARARADNTAGAQTTILALPVLLGAPGVCARRRAYPDLTRARGRHLELIGRAILTWTGRLVLLNDTPTARAEVDCAAFHVRKRAV